MFEILLWSKEILVFHWWVKMGNSMVNSLNEFLFNPDFIFNVHAQVINPLTVYEDALIG